MKVDAKIFKGIEYVQISELPQKQRELLLQTVDPELLIKLLVDGKIISGCIQYKDYLSWYDTQFVTSVSTSGNAAVPSRTVEPNLALNKV